jgi:predicted nucleic acid-binding protein
MIVVDTNLIGYLYLESKHSQQAEYVLRQDADWAAPLLWRSEFRNVLASYLRKQWLSLEESRRLMDEALRMMEDQEYEVDSDRVLRLVADSTCSAYDCEFVALAQELGTFLVTLDKEILNDFPAVAVSVDTFLNAQA